MSRPWLGILLPLALAALGTPVGAATAVDRNEAERVYLRWCEGCHGATGPLRKQLAGTSLLEKRYQGSKPAALTERTDLTPALINSLVRNGLNSMPHFRKTEISDAQLAALVDYLTNKQAK